MWQLQAPAQLFLFSLTLCARPSSIRASSASRTPKVDELPEGWIKGIECWDILSASQYMVNILDISQKANTWCHQQARTKPDCALTSLAFRFCAAFMCALLALKAWHTPSRERLQTGSTKHPFNPNTKLPRAALVVAAWARPAPPAAPCPHLQSQAITDQWWIAPLGHRICLKNPKQCARWLPKTGSKNDIKIQMRHVSPQYTTSKWTMSGQHCCWWMDRTAALRCRTSCVQFSLSVWPARLQWKMLQSIAQQSQLLIFSVQRLHGFRQVVYRTVWHCMSSNSKLVFQTICCWGPQAKSITHWPCIKSLPVRLMLPPNCSTRHARSFKVSKISHLGHWPWSSYTNFAKLAVS